MNSSLTHLIRLFCNYFCFFWIYVSTYKFLGLFYRLKSLFHLFKIFDRCFTLSFDRLCKLKAIFSFLYWIFFIFILRFGCNFIFLLFILENGVVLLIVKLALLNDLERLGKGLVMNWAISFRRILIFIIRLNWIFIDIL